MEFKSIPLKIWLYFVLGYWLLLMLLYTIRCFSKKPFPLSTNTRPESCFSMRTLHPLPPILSQETVGHQQDHSSLSLKPGVGINTHTHAQSNTRIQPNLTLSYSLYHQRKQFLRNCILLWTFHMYILSSWLSLSFLYNNIYSGWLLTVSLFL